MVDSWAELMCPHFLVGMVAAFPKALLVATAVRMLRRRRLSKTIHCRICIDVFGFAAFRES